jgi:hypothetical protein
MTIHLLHGIHTSAKSRRLLAMREDIEVGAQEEVVYHEYGDIWAISTWWQNPRIAKRLLPQIKQGDVLVGHSNGCAIWLRCLDLGAPAVGFVCLNAALKDMVLIPPQVRFMHVYYNAGDNVVPLTKTPLVRLAFDPLWGEMGRLGYTGKDARVWQLDCGTEEDAMPDISGHSILDPSQAQAWAQFIGIQIRSARREVRNDA